MKKYWKGIGVCFICLAAAGVLILKGKTEKAPADEEKGGLQAVTCSIQTGYWEEGCPIQYVLSSREAFEAFNEAHFHIAEKEEFLRQIGEADADFFEKYVLLGALVTSGSGSDQYRISDVKILEDGNIQMTVLRKAAETGTADMSEWFLFARIDREGLNAVPEQFELQIVEE